MRSARRTALAALVAALVLCGYWLLAWSSVRVLLAADVQAREAAWAQGLTPWRWRLGHDGGVVWRGSTGLRRVESEDGTLVGDIVDGNADLSLELRGKPVDLDVARGARLGLIARQPVRATLIADDVVVAAADVPAMQADTEPAPGASSVPANRPPIITVEAAPSNNVDVRRVSATQGDARPAPSQDDAPPAPTTQGDVQLAPTTQDFVTLVPTDTRPASSRAKVLRLHLEASPGTRVTLDELVLVPRHAPAIADCVDAVGCTAQVPRLTPPRFGFPESLLTWRDATLEARPTALVGPATAPGAGFAREVHDATRGNAVWLLALAPVLVGILSRLRVRPLTRRMAALELALVFAPWLLIVWAGAPAEDTPRQTTWLLAGTLVGALLLAPLEGLRFVGNAAAWRAAAKFAGIAIAIVAACVALNAFDGNGFDPRAVTATKLWQYPIWALLQQAVLLHAIAPRTRRATGSDWGGALAAGALFGLLHAPNFALMVVTFGAGIAFAALGHRHRALLPPAAVHAAAGIALVWAAPPWLLRSAEIGGRYLMGA